MKKYVALLALLLCVLLLCSCGDTDDGGNTSPKTQETVTDVSSDDGSATETESTSTESDTDASAKDTKTASDSKNDNTASSTGNEGNASSSGNGNSGGQTNNSSGDTGEQPAFTTDEYELPFIPN